MQPHDCAIIPVIPLFRSPPGPGDTRSLLAGPCENLSKRSRGPLHALEKAIFLSPQSSLIVLSLFPSLSSDPIVICPLRQRKKNADTTDLTACTLDVSHALSRRSDSDGDDI